MTKFTAQSGFTVAIDGPAAAGKGTIASAVAQAFGFAHLDTGLLYRAVGAQMLTGKDPLDAAQSLDPSALEKTNLRTAQVAEAASKVAAISDVRATLEQEAAPSENLAPEATEQPAADSQPAN